MSALLLFFFAKLARTYVLLQVPASLVRALYPGWLIHSSAFASSAEKILLLLLPCYLSTSTLYPEAAAVATAAVIAWLGMHRK